MVGAAGGVGGLASHGPVTWRPTNDQVAGEAHASRVCQNSNMPARRQSVGSPAQSLASAGSGRSTHRPAGLAAPPPRALAAGPGNSRARSRSLWLAPRVVCATQLDHHCLATAVDSAVDRQQGRNRLLHQCCRSVKARWPSMAQDAGCIIRGPRLTIWDGPKTHSPYCPRHAA